MFIREREVKGRTDVNYYTARRLGDMAESLNQLARAFDDGIEKNGQLTKDDGLAAMQASAALVCDNCSRCNLYADSEKEDSYYLYYLLRAFEQKGHIDFEDMPQMFQSGCRKKEDYLAQLNRSLGRATMNLSWKNRFLESRDAVISQFRELSVILEEFSHQIDRARDITDEYEYILKKYFKRYHVDLFPTFTSCSDYAVLFMIKEKLGIGMVPELLTKLKEQNFSTLTTRYLDPMASREIGLAVKNYNESTLAVRNFVKTVQNYISPEL